MTEKKRLGFACISPERRKEISRLGGYAVQRVKTAHKWTSESARAAAQKSVLARAAKKAAVELEGESLERN